MIEQTHGIVLNYLKYKESSIIVKVFTRRFGLKSFIVNGIRSKKAKRSIGIFQPFTLLELQIYYHEKNDLLRLNEAKITRSTPSISQNIKKSTIALFLTEVIGKTLYHEHHENHQLYLFLQNSILELEQLVNGIEDFHLDFLIKYSPYLGFAFADSSVIQSIDLSVSEDAYLTDRIYRCFGVNPSTPQHATGEIRKKCLEAVIAYYQEHIEGLGEIKSLKVLHQIFH
jgi:DNA repair protein RecO (recombination protein O)